VAEHFDEFDRELRDSLQPRPAPPGLASRILARVEERESRRHAWIPLWRWSVAAVLAALMVAGGLEHDRRQRIEGERARAQVLVALRIAGTALHDVQRKVAATGAAGSKDQSGSARDETQDSR
jgi:hypothetical protein